MDNHPQTRTEKKKDQRKKAHGDKLGSAKHIRFHEKLAEKGTQRSKQEKKQ